MFKKCFQIPTFPLFLFIASNFICQIHSVNDIMNVDAEIVKRVVNKVFAEKAKRENLREENFKIIKKCEKLNDINLITLKDGLIKLNELDKNIFLNAPIPRIKTSFLNAENQQNSEITFLDIYWNDPRILKDFYEALKKKKEWNLEKKIIEDIKKCAEKLYKGHLDSLVYAAKLCKNIEANFLIKNEKKVKEICQKWQPIAIDLFIEVHDSKKLKLKLNAKAAMELQEKIDMKKKNGEKFTGDDLQEFLKQIKNNKKEVETKNGPLKLRVPKERAKELQEKIKWKNEKGEKFTEADLEDFLKQKENKKLDVIEEEEEEIDDNSGKIVGEAVGEQKIHKKKGEGKRRVRFEENVKILNPPESEIGNEVEVPATM